MDGTHAGQEGETMTTTYQICDGDGYELSNGLSGDDVDRVAQRLADDLGASVYVSAEDDRQLGHRVYPSDEVCD